MSHVDSGWLCLVAHQDGHQCFRCSRCGEWVSPREKDGACRGDAEQLAETVVADGSHLERVHEDDEIVCDGGSFHMERMDDDHIWFQWMASHSTSK